MSAKKDTSSRPAKKPRTFRNLLISTLSGLSALTFVSCLTPATPAMAQLPLGTSVQTLVPQVEPSVVTIHVAETDQYGEQGYAAGTGFVVDPSGYIVTNHHVVGGEDPSIKIQAISVTLSDGTTLPATIVGTDDKIDIAVLKINAGKYLQPVQWGNSDTAAVGEPVFAVGNPLDLGITVTGGIISAKDRVVGAGPYDDFIQTDAPINPGNSGGPLFNMQGQVIGMDTLIMTPTQGVNASAGLGFALPSNEIQKSVHDIIAYGHVNRGTLGVVYQPVTAANSGGNPGMPPTILPGAQVVSVVPGSAGATAGLQPNDVILALNGQPVASVTDFVRFMAISSPGDKIALTVDRKGTDLTLNAIAGGAQPIAAPVAPTVITPPPAPPQAVTPPPPASSQVSPRAVDPMPEPPLAPAPVGPKAPQAKPPLLITP